MAKFQYGSTNVKGEVDISLYIPLAESSERVGKLVEDITAFIKSHPYVDSNDGEPQIRLGTPGIPGVRIKTSMEVQR